MLLRKCAPDRLLLRYCTGNVATLLTAFDLHCKHLERLCVCAESLLVHRSALHPFIRASLVYPFPCPCARAIPPPAGSPGPTPGCLPRQEAGSSGAGAAAALDARLAEAVQIRGLLARNTEEVDGLLRALGGEYVLPEAGGDLLRDGAGVLPTGAAPLGREQTLKPLCLHLHKLRARAALLGMRI